MATLKEHMIKDGGSERFRESTSKLADRPRCRLAHLDSKKIKLIYLCRIFSNKTQKYADPNVAGVFFAKEGIFLLVFFTPIQREYFL